MQPGQSGNRLSRRGQAGILREVLVPAGSKCQAPRLDEAWGTSPARRDESRHGGDAVTVVASIRWLAGVACGQGRTTLTDEVPRRLGRERPTGQSNDCPVTFAPSKPDL